MPQARPDLLEVPQIDAQDWIALEYTSLVRTGARLTPAFCCYPEAWCHLIKAWHFVIWLWFLAELQSSLALLKRLAFNCIALCTAKAFLPHCIANARRRSCLCPVINFVNE